MTLTLLSCSEGIFKCPEDQLPLEYAKVSLAHGWDAGHPHPCIPH